MKKYQLYRGATIGISAFTTALFGFAGAAPVQAASISNTGPGSHNRISWHQSSNCHISNNNNVSMRYCCWRYGNLSFGAKKFDYEILAQYLKYLLPGLALPLQNRKARL